MLIHVGYAILQLAGLGIVLGALEWCFPNRAGQPRLRRQWTTDLAFYFGQHLVWLAAEVAGQRRARRARRARWARRARALTADQHLLPAGQHRRGWPHGQPQLCAYGGRDVGWRRSCKGLLITGQPRRRPLMLTLWSPMRPLPLALALAVLSATSGCEVTVDPYLDPEAMDAESTGDPAIPDDVIKLNLRVHIMQSDPWIHRTGVPLTTWVTPRDVTDTILPEMNSIWSPAKIRWDPESIILEDIAKDPGYQDSIAYVLAAERNDQGQADPQRLRYLYRLMQPKYRSTEAELGHNLFHVYLFPFTGNTSQGNAMAAFGYHVVTGIWTNKYTDSDAPERHYLTESQDKFVRGSISQSLARELGAVLGLANNQCTECLMSSDGYTLTQAQIDTARQIALMRSK
jgi:hypothetical protein